MLSESVANGLQMVVGEEASETVKFVKMMDRFFDCLNVNNFNRGKQKRKIFQDPYRGSSDFRLKVMFTMHMLHSLKLIFLFSAVA